MSAQASVAEMDDGLWHQAKDEFDLQRNRLSFLKERQRVLHNTQHTRESPDIDLQRCNTEVENKKEEFRAAALILIDRCKERNSRTDRRLEAMQVKLSNLCACIEGLRAEQFCLTDGEKCIVRRSVQNFLSHIMRTYRSMRGLESRELLSPHASPIDLAEMLLENDRFRLYTKVMLFIRLRAHKESEEYLRRVDRNTIGAKGDFIDECRGIIRRCTPQTSSMESRTQAADRKRAADFKESGRNIRLFQEAPLTPGDLAQESLD